MKKEVTWLALGWIILFFACMDLTSCATHSPDLIVAKVPSPTVTGQHSGVVRTIYAPDGSILGQVFDQTWKDYYDKLLAQYNMADSSVTRDGNFWWAPNTSIAQYALLNEMHKADAAGKKP